MIEVFVTGANEASKTEEEFNSFISQVESKLFTAKDSALLNCFLMERSYAVGIKNINLQFRSIVSPSRNEKIVYINALHTLLNTCCNYLIDYSTEYYDHTSIHELSLKAFPAQYSLGSIVEILSRNALTPAQLEIQSKYPSSVPFTPRMPHQYMSWKSDKTIVLMDYCVQHNLY